MVRPEDLVTFGGFLSAFWKEFRSSPGVSQEDVYDRLNGVYFAAFGEDRFSSFDAFRKRRDRFYKKIKGRK